MPFDPAACSSQTPIWTYVLCLCCCNSWPRGLAYVCTYVLNMSSMHYTSMPLARLHLVSNCFIQGTFMYRHSQYSVYSKPAVAVGLLWAKILHMLACAHLDYWCLERGHLNVCQLLCWICTLRQQGESLHGMKALLLHCCRAPFNWPCLDKTAQRVLQIILHIHAHHTW
jgi:hypothetical protein